MKLFAALCSFLLLLSAPAFADKAAAVTYSKTVITLHRHSQKLAAQQMPWQNGDLDLTVEVRDGNGMYNQSGWFNLSSYGDNAGVMMVFAEPDLKPIVPSSQYAPTDILFINEEGKIIQIAPGINLSELDKNVYPASPVLAYLFMKGGSCAELSIAPGDEVEYAIFKKPPLILSQPPAPAPAAAPVNIPTVTDIPLPAKPLPTGPVIKSY